MPRLTVGIPEGSPIWHFVGLENNWDRNGALAPTPMVLENSQEFINLLSEIFGDITDHVEIAANGHIRFGWIGKRGFLLSIEISDKEHAWSMSVPSLGDQEGNTLTVKRLVAVYATFNGYREGG